MPSLPMALVMNINNSPDDQDIHKASCDWPTDTIWVVIVDCHLSSEVSCATIKSV